jgi:riboflavin synthase
MFTGLIRDVGTVRALERTGEGARVRIATGLPADALAHGASVAVDGCCLTVTEAAAGEFSAFASAETLARTTLGARAAGDRVNLEPPMAAGERLGGHFVLGHVDAVGRVSSAREVGEALEVEYAYPDRFAALLVEKGSVAVDGVSLTVNRLSAGVFAVMLIPETRALTALAAKPVGAPVNLEFDVLGKYVLRALEAQKGAGGVTKELLEKAGFIG